MPVKTPVSFNYSSLSASNKGGSEFLFFIFLAFDLFTLFKYSLSQFFVENSLHASQHRVHSVINFIAQ